MAAALNMQRILGNHFDQFGPTLLPPQHHFQPISPAPIPVPAIMPSTVQVPVPVRPFRSTTPPIVMPPRSAGLDARVDALRRYITREEALRYPRNRNCSEARAASGTPPYQDDHHHMPG